ncbi:hypothetical protein [Kitasatospora sp. GAS1066B]
MNEGLGQISAQLALGDVGLLRVPARPAGPHAARLRSNQRAALEPR